MRLYFDVSTLNPQKVTGVGVYMLQLLRHFKAHPDVELWPVLKLSRLKNKSAIESTLGLSCRPLLPWTLFPGAESVFHGPDFKLNTWGPFPRIVTVHDMVVFEEKYNRPDFYLKGIREMTRVLTAPGLDAVIVNSEFTKKEVLRFFPHLSERIYVTHLGCNRAQETVTHSLDLPEKYVLYLGTLEKRKNVSGVLKAFEILKSQGAPEKLVLAGGWGFGAEEIQAQMAASAYKSDIIHLSYVPDGKLAELYSRARAFFFPSWYEGFGIPVLEAMALGCPVVTSQGGALQEVCGDAALFADPADPENMAQVLKQVLSQPELREKMQKQGRERAAQFTWERCAEKTLQVYRQVLGR